MRNPFKKKPGPMMQERAQELWEARQRIREEQNRRAKMVCARCGISWYSHSYGNSCAMFLETEEKK